MSNKKNVPNQDGKESKKEVIEQKIKEEIIVPEETKEEVIVPDETPEETKEVIEQEVHIEKISEQEETIIPEEKTNRWEGSPHLEGLSGEIDDSQTKLFESTPNQQVPNETPEEDTNEIPEEDTDEIPEEDTNETPEEDTDEIPEEDTDETPEEDTDDDDIEEEVAPRTIQSLSKSELRLFQRTGLMPK